MHTYEHAAYLIVILVLLFLVYRGKENLVIADTVNYRNRQAWPTKAYDRYYYY